MNSIRFHKHQYGLELAAYTQKVIYMYSSYPFQKALCSGLLVQKPVNFFLNWKTGSFEAIVRFLGKIML